MEENENNGTEKRRSAVRSMSRLNIAMSAVFLVIVLALIWWMRSLTPGEQSDRVNDSVDASDTVEVMPPVSAVVEPTGVIDEKTMRASYEQDVLTAFAGLSLSDAAAVEAVLAEMLEVTVPATRKEFHLDLVIALTEAQAGKLESAQKKIDQLSAAHDWFTTKK